MTLTPGMMLLHEKYRVESLLGAGAFAEVYRVLHLQLNAPRAVKILRRDAAGLSSTEFGDYRARFELEAQLGAQLHHPHVIGVHDFEEEDGALMLVMELAPGGSLADRIKKARSEGHPLAVEEAMTIAREIAEGLSALHAQEAVHRDVKPSNILFDVEGHAKLADLGLAQVPHGGSMRSSLSTAVKHPGTPSYMSPEQRDTGDPLQPPSDVYALGCVLFEMLSGRMYYNQRPGTRARGLRPEIDRGLDDLLARMLAAKAVDRPWDGAEAAELLQEAARNRAEEKQRKQQVEEWRAAASIKAEQERLGAEQQRKAEEARRRAEEQRKEEERRKQAELEANRRKQEDLQRQEETRRREEEAKKAAAGLVATGSTLLERGEYGQAEAKLQEALRLDPPNVEAKATLERCRAQKAAAEERRQGTQSQKTSPAAAKTNSGRRAAIRNLAIGIMIGIIVAVILIVADSGNKEQGSPSAGPTADVIIGIIIGAVFWIGIIVAVIRIVARSRNKKKGSPSAGPAAEPTSSSPVDTRTISSAITEMEFVAIPAGKFMMGCSPGDSQCDGVERPRHEVTISRGIELGKYEVTQGQWVKVMGNNPSHFKGDDRLPVEKVSWNDVQAFIEKLNALNDGYRYRLPTEAEWEYGARGGTAGPYYGNLDATAWYRSNSGSKTHPVGQKQPNGYGLYDMLGNVGEWCSDWYGESYYGGSPAADPAGPSSGQERVVRGGSWYGDSGLARVSVRFRNGPDGRGSENGFRVCREKL